ncbi:MAG: energy transducer TonB [Verrucomicrobiae bacterium]|nr:energy transducer TonB [Verrucomicrobiae bacterium]
MRTPKDRFLAPFAPKGASRRRMAPFAAMGLCAAATFLLLPFTTLLSASGKTREELRMVEVSLPPPPPPPPDFEPPPEDTPPPEPEPPDTSAQPLSLAQMEIALNPGFGDALAGGFNIDSFATQTEATTVADLQIFDVQDLDRPPARIRTVTPTYPLELRRARVQGTVVLLLIIDQSGRVTVDRVLESSVREFVQPAVAAAEQCLFEPPMKGGQPVRARYRMQVPFRL